MFVQTKVLPKVLSFAQAKYYVFSTAFVGAAVFFPWLCHQFNLAGAIFLPMHFFVMFAGFLFGWRTGLLVGVLSPIFSYSITHMPPAAILWETTLELGVYGLAIGLLREKKMNIWVALLGAMILGRLARFLFVLGLGLETNPLWYFQLSWPGIALQVSLVPLIVYLLQKFVFKDEKAI